MSITPSPGHALPPEEEPERPVRSAPPPEPSRRYYQEPAPAPPPSRGWFQPAVLVALGVLAVGEGFIINDLSNSKKASDQQVAALKERSATLERREDAADERYNGLR